MTKRPWRHLDRETRQKVMRLRAKGKTYREIIAEVGISMGSVGAILKTLGGVLRLERWSCSPFRLSLDERIEIYIGLELGLTFSAIAA
jgi:hypothetical protein